MDEASIVARTDALVKSFPSLSISPLNFLNSPFTLVIIKCFTLNTISLCVGSIAHFVFVEVFTAVSIVFDFKNCLSIYFYCLSFSIGKPGVTSHLFLSKQKLYTLHCPAH